MANSVDTIPPVKNEEDKTKKADEEPKVKEPTNEDFVKGVADNIGALAKSDINQAINLVKALAEQAGFTLSTKEAEEAAKSLPKKEEPVDKFEALQSELSEEYPELAPKLIKGFRDILAERDQKFEVKLNQFEKDRLDSEVDQIFQDPEIKANEKEILELMDTVAPKPGVTVKKYITTLAQLVSGDKDLEINPLKKIARNLEERRISSGIVDETVIKKGPSRPTLRQAVEAAVRNERFDQ